MRLNPWPFAWMRVMQGAIVMGLSMVCGMEVPEVLLIKLTTANCKVPEFLTLLAMDDGTISIFTLNVITVL